MKGTSPGAWLRLAILAVALTLLMAGTANAAGYNLYFGDIHSHTNVSDGYGTLEEAYSAARAAALRGDLDFFGTTDHVHCSYGQLWLTADTLADVLDTANRYNQDGLLVTLPGYELWLPWMTCGEMNIYNVTEVFGQSANPAGNGYNNGHQDGLANVLPKLYDWLAAGNAIGQWNHPDYYGGDTSANRDWYQFAFYTPERDRAVNMIEIWNEITYESAYVEALDADWHVLPSANSDRHYDEWITACDVRTVLLAEKLTRADLLDAMRASRGYATEDKNLEVRYSLGGQVMGSTLTPKTSYTASIQVYDPNGAKDAVKRVEIVSDGGVVVASKAFNSAKVSWSPTVSSTTARYFYVRVTTASDFWGDEGVTAWTAPVWTGR
jgi:hypothetical protein